MDHGRATTTGTTTITTSITRGPRGDSDWVSRVRVETGSPGTPTTGGPPGGPGTVRVRGAQDRRPPHTPGVSRRFTSPSKRPHAHNIPGVRGKPGRFPREDYGGASGATPGPGGHPVRRGTSSSPLDPGPCDRPWDGKPVTDASTGTRSRRRTVSSGRTRFRQRRTPRSARTPPGGDLRRHCPDPTALHVSHARVGRGRAGREGG